jgi:hypothetical protein
VSDFSEPAVCPDCGATATSLADAFTHALETGHFVETAKMRREKEHEEDRQEEEQ